MKIDGTEWYTASGYKSKQIEGSERSMIEVVYGYRMPVLSRSPKEISDLQNILKSDGVVAKLKTSKHDHTGIPAGTPFLQVLDEESAIALERLFLKSGINLAPDRFKEYGLEHIDRPKKEVSIVQKKGILNSLFGRK